MAWKKIVSADVVPDIPLSNENELHKLNLRCCNKGVIDLDLVWCNTGYRIYRFKMAVDLNGGGCNTEYLNIE